MPFDIDRSRGAFSLRVTDDGTPCYGAIDCTPVEVVDTYLSDNGDDDGWADPHETVEMRFSVVNRGARDVSGLVARLSASDPHLSCVAEDEVYIGKLAAGETRIVPERAVLLRHVAGVEIGTGREEMLFRVNAQPTVALVVFQEGGANLIRLGRALRQRLDELRAEQERRKETPRYDHRCRAVSREESDARAAAGEPHVLRFRVPEGETVVLATEVTGVEEGRLSTLEVAMAPELAKAGLVNVCDARVCSGRSCGVGCRLRGCVWFV